MKISLPSFKLPWKPAFDRKVAALTSGALLGVLALTFQGDIQKALGPSSPPPETVIEAPVSTVPSVSPPPVEVAEELLAFDAPVSEPTVPASPTSLPELETHTPDSWIEFKCPSSTRPLLDPKGEHVGCILAPD